MALTKDKKNEIVSSVGQLLADSKLTVISAYQGTPVKAMQQLRRQGRDNGTVFKVVKNRLVVQALKSNDKTKDLDTGSLTGMLLYAFNEQDEVAPAQTLANFAKTQPTLEFVGAITADGKLMSADEVKVYATLPSKNQLIAGVINTLNSPLKSAVSSLSGNLHGLLSALEAKAAN